MTERHDVFTVQTHERRHIAAEHDDALVGMADSEGIISQRNPQFVERNALDMYETSCVVTNTGPAKLAGPEIKDSDGIYMPLHDILLSVDSLQLAVSN